MKVRNLQHVGAGIQVGDEEARKALGRQKSCHS